MKIDWSKITNRTMFLAALQILHVCQMCGKCCGKDMAGIAMNSADVARMAKQLGMGRTEFITKYTRPSPNKPTDRWLQPRDSDGACPFLSKHGCTQYDGRGQVCRLYPYTAPDQLERAKRNLSVFLYQTCPEMVNTYLKVARDADTMSEEAAASILASDLGKYCMLNAIRALHGDEAARHAARDIGLKEIPDADRLNKAARAFAVAYCTQIGKKKRAELIKDLEDSL